MLFLCSCLRYIALASSALLLSLGRPPLIYSSDRHRQRKAHCEKNASEKHSNSHEPIAPSTLWLSLAIAAHNHPMDSTDHVGNAPPIGYVWLYDEQQSSIGAGVSCLLRIE
jgi:hypothetical protein